MPLADRLPDEHRQPADGGKEFEEHAADGRSGLVRARAVMALGYRSGAGLPIVIAHHFLLSFREGGNPAQLKKTF